jgi:hypothetical protein
MDNRSDHRETNKAFNAQWLRDHRLFNELIQLVRLIPAEYREPLLRFELSPYSSEGYSEGYDGGYFSGIARAFQRQCLSYGPDHQKYVDHLRAIASTICIDCLTHIQRGGATAQGEQILSELSEALIIEVLDQCNSSPA